MQRHTYLAGLLGVACWSAAACASAPASTAANGRASVSLTGTVTSDAEGAMEGVLVSAKAVGGTVTVTVVSNRQGRYGFPADRLPAGRYRLSVRAAGYDLVDPGVVNIAANQATAVDMTLETTTRLAAQLMNAEWLASFPGTPEQKKQWVANCVDCHSIELVARSRYDAKQWMSALERMNNHSNGSGPLKPFDAPLSPRYAKYWGKYAETITASSQRSDGEGALPAISPEREKQAAYLASINLSRDAKWAYDLKTFPRPTGSETRVIMTEYDLPRPDTQPHDVLVDADGMVWYLDFSDSFFGRLNSRTGEVKEWRLPIVRPYPPFHGGGLDLDMDADGNVWMALQRQAAIAKFVKKTEQITTWSVPSPYNKLGTIVPMLAVSPTGMVWFRNYLYGATREHVHGLNPKTGKITTYEIPVTNYGLQATPDGNLVLYSIQSDLVVVLDTQTGKTTMHKTTPGSGPRRGYVDAQGRAWYAGFRGGRIGMFDPRTTALKEWPVPPNIDPYDVIVDRTGDAWSGGMATDYIVRLNPMTGAITKYLMPTVNVNIRGIEVDRANKPVVWVGENHHAKILRLETLD